MGVVSFMPLGKGPWYLPIGQSLGGPQSQSECGGKKISVFVL